MVQHGVSGVGEAKTQKFPVNFPTTDWEGDSPGLIERLMDFMRNKRKRAIDWSIHWSICLQSSHFPCVDTFCSCSDWQRTPTVAGKMTTAKRHTSPLSGTHPMSPETRTCLTCYGSMEAATGPQVCLWTWTRVGKTRTDKLRRSLTKTCNTAARSWCKKNMTRSRSSLEPPFFLSTEASHLFPSSCPKQIRIVLALPTPKAQPPSLQQPPKVRDGWGAHHKANRPRIGGGIRQLNPANPVPVPHEHRRLFRLVPVELAQDRSFVPRGPPAAAPTPAPAAVAPGLAMALVGLVGEVLRQE